MSEASRGICRSAFLPAFALFASAWAAAPVHAQNADQAAAAPGQGLEEIVVTAERRSTDIQKTALAVSAIKADVLEKANIEQLADIDGRVPSLTITHSSGYETVTTIRGIGYETTENEGSTYPGVSLFIDGVYIANTIALDETLFDIDHIEILRGPQGALYGQSSTGGAISITTKQPKLDDFSGSADVQLGNYNLHRERGEINIPLGDTFALRISAQNYGHDGFTRNVALKGDDLDDANDVSGKAALLWQPTDDFKATLSTESYSSDFNGAAQKNINDPNPDPWTVSQDYPSRFALNTNVSHLNLEWDLPWFTVKSVTAYQYLDHHQAEDSSRTTYALLGKYDDVAAWNTKMYNYNEEFDLQSNGDTALDWTTGVFLLSQKFQQYVAEFGGSTPPPAGGFVVAPNLESLPTSQTGISFGQKVVTDRQSYSWFAQGTYHFTDELRLVGGVRVNYDSETAYVKNFGNALTAASNWDMVPTWVSRLEYDLTPDNMLYGSFSRGYKPGGSNGQGSGLFNNGPSSPYRNFTPETNTSFEVGAKNSFMDRHLTVNVAGFYYLYKNMQFLYTDPIPYSGGIGNIPSTHIWGGEIESSYAGGPDNRLKIDASLSAEDGAIQGNFYTLDSTIENQLAVSTPACNYGGAYYNPGCWAAEIKAERNISGNMPPKMPSVQGSIALSYDFPVYGGTFTPRVEYIYRGQMWARVFEEPSVDNIPAYSLVNLNLEYVPDDAPWKVQFAVTNLTDEAGINSRYTDPYGTFQTSNQYIPPRQFTGTVSYTFGGATSTQTAASTYTPPAATPAAPAPVAHSYMVFFDFNKSDLTPQAVSIVDSAAANAGPAHVTQLTVTGHTDTVGSDAYNMRLSRRRAESVAAELEAKGIPSSEIEIVAKGKHDLLVPTGDGVREPQNRRVQIVYAGGPTS